MVWYYNDTTHCVSQKEPEGPVLLAGPASYDGSRWVQHYVTTSE